MKLTNEIKKKIDAFFDNVSAEELFDKAVNKYGFSEEIDFEFENQVFSKGHKSNYSSKNDGVQGLEMTTIPLAA